MNLNIFFLIIFATMSKIENDLLMVVVVALVGIVVAVDARM